MQVVLLPTKIRRLGTAEKVCKKKKPTVVIYYTDSDHNNLVSDI